MCQSVGKPKASQKSTNFIMPSKTIIDYADSLICHMLPDWKDKYAYRLLKLRCIYGLPPRIAKSINTKPGENYFHCGNLSIKENVGCKLFVWDADIHHFHESLCYCGQLTFLLNFTKTNRYYYVCMYKKTQIQFWMQLLCTP